MRTPDFEAYDDFKDITANTAGNTFVNSFRGLMLTNSLTNGGGCTFTIQHLGGSPVSLQAAKTIQAHTGINGGTVIVPVSGDAVSVNVVGTGTKVYALI